MKSNSKRTWMLAAVSGTTGLLLGGIGAMYAPEAIATIRGLKNSDENLDYDSESKHPLLGDELPIANTSDDMSFNEAFAEAREEVGPGGVFYWRGGIYGTYTKDEWDNLSAEEKTEFNELANEMFPEPEDPEYAIKPQDVEEMAYEPDAHGQKDEVMAEADPVVLGRTTVGGHLAAEVDGDGDGQVDYLLVDADDSKDLTSDDLVIDRSGNVVKMSGDYLGNLAEENTSNTANAETQDDEVVVIGYGEYDGHSTVGLDTRGDGYADIAIVDVDDDGNLSPDDIVVTDDGQAATVGELMDEAESLEPDDSDTNDDLSDDMVSI